MLLGQNFIDNGLSIVCSPDGENFVLPAVHYFGAYKHFFTSKVAGFILFQNVFSKNKILILLW
jgi:hypothetical protein